VWFPAGISMNINMKGTHIRVKMIQPKPRIKRGILLIIIKLLIELYKKYPYLKPTIRTIHTLQLRHVSFLVWFLSCRIDNPKFSESKIPGRKFQPGTHIERKGFTESL
jgi:hypothetical protein